MERAPHSPVHSVLRRGLLAAGAWGMSGLPARAQMPAPALPTLLTPPLPAGPTGSVSFDVAGEAQNRLIFATLRCTVPVQAISLLDPAGRVVWRRTAAELGFRVRATLPRPELGDGYVLPPVQDAAAGRWQLRIERGPPTGGSGRLQLAYSVFPRYELDIVPARLRAAAGQTLLVSVRPRDYGVPVAGLSAIEVQVLDAQGRRVALVAATEHRRSREGITLSQEPGVYLAQFSLPAAGNYRLQATRQLGDTATSTKTAVAELSVEGASGALVLQAVRLDPGTGGCAKGLLLDFAVQAATAGLYTCNLTLRGGNPALPRAGASAELAAGPGQITVAVSAAKLAAIGLPWQRLDRAVLLQMKDTEFRVVAELTDLDLTGFGIDPAALCR